MENRGQTNRLVLLVVILSIILVGLVSAGIIYNGTELEDSTVYNSNNTCVANKLNMNIYINPCNVSTMSGKNITQYVDFKWTGLTQKTSWVFVYDNLLEKAQMFLPYNETYEYNETYYTNDWVNNYQVHGINSYVNLGTPDERCNYGNSNNTYMFEINRTTETLAKQVAVYCFSSSIQTNATSYNLSGNYDKANYRMVNRTRESWNDISNQITFLGCGLLNDSRCYYQVQNVTFLPNQQIRTKWVYSPLNHTRTGKWHIFGYSAEKTIDQAITDNEYIYLDPSWTNGLNNGIYGYWTLNESSGTLYDSVSNFTNDGTATGGTQGVGGQINNSVLFSDDYINIPDDASFDIPSAQTWSAWIYSSSFLDNCWIIGRDSNTGVRSFAYGMGGDDVLYIQINGEDAIGNACQSTASAIVNQWNHVVYTFDNATKTGGIWLNGVNVTGTNCVFSVAIPTGANAIRFGARQYSGSEGYFDGNIDEVSWWGRILTPAEILELNTSISYDPDPSEATSGSPLGINTTLDFPVNNSINSSALVLFNATALPSNGTVINMTINIWNSALTLVNDTINTTTIGVLNSSTWNIANLITGNYTWNVLSCAVNATDSACAYAPFNRSFEIDKTKPLINFTFPVMSSGNYSQSSIWVNVTATDDHLGTINLTLYNSTWTNSSYSTTSGFYLNFTGLKDGIYYVNASVNDTLGNTNSTEIRSFNLDTIKPIITFATPSLSQGNYSQSSIWANASITDENFNTINLTIYNSTWANSSYSTVNNFYLNFTNLKDGAYTINISANDSAGNTNSSIRVFNLDTIKPILNFTYPVMSSGNYSQSSIWANVTSVDTASDTIIIYLYNSTDLIGQANSSVRDSSFFYNFTSLPSSEWYYINASVNDSAGNINWTETRAILLDYISPLINYSYLTSNNNSNLSQNSLLINVTSIDIFLRNITIFIYNSTSLVNSSFSVNSFAVNFTNLRNDTYWFNASSTDTTGNINWTETRQVLLDYVYPQINYTTGTTSEGAWSQTWIFVNVTASDTYLRNITIYLYNASGIINSTFSTTSTLAINFTNLKNDTYSVNASACDSTHNCNWTDTRSYIFLDAVYPRMGFGYLTPINNSNVSRRTIFVNVTAIDNNMKNITINLYNSTGIVNSSNVSGTGQLLALNFTVNRDGIYYYNGTGCDQVGNCNNTETRTILVDTILPIISIVSPISNDFPNFISSILIPVNLSITETNLEKCWYKVNDSQTISNTTFNCASGYNNFSFVVTDDGHFELFVYSNDSSGNQNFTNTTFTVTKSTSPQTGGGGGAVGSDANTMRYNNSIICPLVKDFILNYRKVNYTQLQLDNLTRLINVYHSPDLQSNEIEVYVTNYSTKCGSLPVEKVIGNITENFTFFELEIPKSDCLPNLNTTFTILNVEFPMDTSLPFINIDIGEPSCTSIGYLRWIFQIEPTGSYTITGIRLWWILLIVIVTLSILLVKTLKRQPKK